MRNIRNNQYIIDLSAVRYNINILRSHIPANTRMMVIVKANAYGTDAPTMSKFLGTCGIDCFGVSFVDEGIALRQAGIKEDIFVLSAFPHQAEDIVGHNLQAAIDNEVLVKALAQAAKNLNTVAKVHLHVDTGMCRLGCHRNEALSLASLIRQHPSLTLEGAMSHFAAAEDPKQDSFTIQQANTLNDVIFSLKEKKINVPWVHIANSSAAVRFSFPQFNMVRFGLAIYGIMPSQEAKAINLQNALSLTSRIIGIGTYKKGDTISYGRTYTVSDDSVRIATIPIGYFDGLHRRHSNQGFVIIHQHKAPIVGTICMDYTMADVTNIPNVDVGDDVLIFGNGYDIHDVATQGETIPHELVSGLGPRIPRVFIGG